MFSQIEYVTWSMEMEPQTTASTASTTLEDSLVPSPTWSPVPGALASHTAVIVGGSSGVGLAAAKLLRGFGARVVLVARDAARLAEAASNVRAVGHPTAPEAVRTVVADGTDEDPLRDALDQLDRIEHVLTTAATVAFGSLADTPRTQAEANMDSRLWGAYTVARVTADRLPPGGSLTFCSGDLVTHPQPSASLVAASLGAVEAFTRALALELAPRRVRANTIRLGTIDTNLLRGFLGAATDQEANDMVAHLGAELPLGRVGTADEAAAAALFAMSNPYVTGSTITVDGGQTLA